MANNNSQKYKDFLKSIGKGYTGTFTNLGSGIAGAAGDVLLGAGELTDSELLKNAANEYIEETKDAYGNINKTIDDKLKVSSNSTLNTVGQGIGAGIGSLTTLVPAMIATGGLVAPAIGYGASSYGNARLEGDSRLGSLVKGGAETGITLAFGGSGIEKAGKEIVKEITAKKVLKESVKNLSKSKPITKKVVDTTKDIGKEVIEEELILGANLAADKFIEGKDVTVDDVINKAKETAILAASGAGAGNIISSGIKYANKPKQDNVNLVNTKDGEIKQGIVNLDEPIKNEDIKNESVNNVSDFKYYIVANSLEGNNDIGSGMQKLINDNTITESEKVNAIVSTANSDKGNYDTINSYLNSNPGIISTLSPRSIAKVTSYFNNNQNTDEIAKHTNIPSNVFKDVYTNEDLQKVLNTAEDVSGDSYNEIINTFTNTSDNNHLINTFRTNNYNPLLLNEVISKPNVNSLKLKNEVLNDVITNNGINSIKDLNNLSLVGIFNLDNLNSAEKDIVVNKLRNVIKPQSLLQQNTANIEGDQSIKLNTIKNLFKNGIITNDEALAIANQNNYDIKELGKDLFVEEAIDMSKLLKTELTKDSFTIDDFNLVDGVNNTMVYQKTFEVMTDITNVALEHGAKVSNISIGLKGKTHFDLTDNSIFINMNEIKSKTNYNLVLALSHELGESVYASFNKNLLTASSNMELRISDNETFNVLKKAALLNYEMKKHWYNLNIPSLELSYLSACNDAFTSNSFKESIASMFGEELINKAKFQAEYDSYREGLSSKIVSLIKSFYFSIADKISKYKADLLLSLREYSTHKEKIVTAFEVIRDLNKLANKTSKDIYPTVASNALSRLNTNLNAQDIFTATVAIINIDTKTEPITLTLNGKEYSVIKSTVKFTDIDGDHQVYVFKANDSLKMIICKEGNSFAVSNRLFEADITISNNECNVKSLIPINFLDDNIDDTIPYNSELFNTDIAYLQNIMQDHIRTLNSFSIDNKLYLNQPINITFKSSLISQAIDNDNYITSYFTKRNKSKIKYINDANYVKYIRKQASEATPMSKTRTFISEVFTGGSVTKSVKNNLNTIGLGKWYYTLSAFRNLKYNTLSSVYEQMMNLNETIKNSTKAFNEVVKSNKTNTVLKKLDLKSFSINDLLSLQNLFETISDKDGYIDKDLRLNINKSTVTLNYSELEELFTNIFGKFLIDTKLKDISLSSSNVKGLPASEVSSAINEMSNYIDYIIEKHFKKSGGYDGTIYEGINRYKDGSKLTLDGYNGKVIEIKPYMETIQNIIENEGNSIYNAVINELIDIIEETKTDNTSYYNLIRKELITQLKTEISESDTASSTMKIVFETLSSGFYKSTLLLNIPTILMGINTAITLASNKVINNYTTKYTKDSGNKVFSSNASDLSKSLDLVTDITRYTSFWTANLFTGKIFSKARVEKSFNKEYKFLLEFAPYLLKRSDYSFNKMFDSSVEPGKLGKALDALMDRTLASPDYYLTLRVTKDILDKSKIDYTNDKKAGYDLGNYITDIIVSSTLNPKGLETSALRRMPKGMAALALFNGPLEVASNNLYSIISDTKINPLLKTQKAISFALYTLVITGLIRSIFSALKDDREDAFDNDFLNRFLKAIGWYTTNRYKLDNVASGIIRTYGATGANLPADFLSSLFINKPFQKRNTVNIDSAPENILNKIGKSITIFQNLLTNSRTDFFDSRNFNRSVYEWLKNPKDVTSATINIISAITGIPAVNIVKQFEYIKGVNDEFIK